MNKQTKPHWALQEIAEQEAPASTISLWPGIEATAILSRSRNLRGISGHPAFRIAGALASVLVVATLAFFLVPPVRAAVESIVQRMGIAFVEPQPLGAAVETGKADLVAVTPPPSLSVQEIQGQISFPLLLPTWLPDGLTYTQRDIREYDPQSGEGSGKELTIEYSRTASFDSASGLLFLDANDGPISAPPLLAEGREQAVVVNGQPGYYVHGGWQDDGRGDPNTRLGNLLWEDAADDAYLTWNSRWGHLSAGSSQPGPLSRRPAAHRPIDASPIMIFLLSRCFSKIGA